MNKIFILIFLILLTIIGVEIGYYFSSTQRAKNVSVATNTPSINKVAVSLPNSLLAKRTKMIQSGILTSSVCTNVMKTEVAGVDFTKGVINGFPYKVKLSIKASPTDETTYYLDENSLQKIKVFSIVNDQTEAGILTDLKPGDSVTIEEKMDSTKQPGKALIELIITKNAKTS